MTDEQTQPNNDQPADNLDDKDKQLAELKAQADEYLNGWKRAKADYLNLQKETAEKQKNIMEFANAAVIMELLPVYDNLKKALSLIDNGQLIINNEMKAWVEGIKHVKAQFAEFLKINGIEEIKTVGEKFNPEFHEAVTREKKEGFEPDLIISELTAGYLLKGKLLAAAKVVVAE